MPLKNPFSFGEMYNGLKIMFLNKKMYFGLIIFYFGVFVNILSQEYLHDFTSKGETLPQLSDLILNNLPYWDISFVYDLFSIFALLIFIMYVIHERQYINVPYFFTLCGIFMFIRGIFVVLTPFGQPPLFHGTEGLFNGFSKFELGVYPSGHTAISFMYFLLAKKIMYRFFILSCVVIIVTSLFLSRGHYSIDVLSGIFFAYAIKSFGDKHFYRYFSGSGTN